MPTNPPGPAELHELLAAQNAKLDLARDEYRKLLRRVQTAEADLRKKTNLVLWVISALGGDAPPDPPSEGEAPEAGQVKCWVDDAMVTASGKATDHVKRLQLLIDLARYYPPQTGGRLAPGARAEDWVRLLDQVRTHLTESGVTL